MKKTIAASITAFLIFSALSSASNNIRPIPIETVRSAFANPVVPHPRIFLTDDQLPAMREKIDSSPELKNLYNIIIAKADSILTKPPVKRIKTGRRLLHVSRECLSRTMILSIAYRFTRQKKYLDRAEKEMLAAAAFTDWNPSHFLDVAEMTAALAIGCDWLYNDLPDASRKKITDAIMTKGIEPSLNIKGWWVTGKNNWNQVCHGGITLGALALMEDYPDIAKKIVHRAVNNVQIAMNEYEPNGAYPEGPGYWVYGTSFNVMLIAALESALSTDFGLSNMNGFAKSAEYFLHITGPTDLFFNYPDSGSRTSLVPTVFWFADKYKDPSLAFNQHRYLKEAMDKKTSITSNRLIPLALIWAADKSETPEKLSWMGHGINPVAAFRTSWTDPDAAYLAIKGGSPSAPHGHMDVGSFVYDAKGLRWALDLGPESYHKIESLGMNLWNQSQNSDRWKIFRYSNHSHNTLVVNNRLQQVTGRAPITKYSADKDSSSVTIDMTNVYKGQLTSAIRTAALLPDGTITIHDQLRATDKPATIRWAMVTPAKVEIKSDKLALLKQKGKTITFRLQSDIDTKITTYPTTPHADYDAPNPNTQMIGFEIKLPPNKKTNLTVTITP